jgi:hypothetical protein
MLIEWDGVAGRPQVYLSHPGDGTMKSSCCSLSQTAVVVKGRFMKPTIKSIVASLALATAFSMPTVQSFAAPAKGHAAKVSHQSKAKVAKGKKARQAHKVKGKSSSRSGKLVKKAKGARANKARKNSRAKA